MCEDVGEVRKREAVAQVELLFIILEQFEKYIKSGIRTKRGVIETFFDIKKTHFRNDSFTTIYGEDIMKARFVAEMENTL